MNTSTTVNERYNTLCRLPCQTEPVPLSSAIERPGVYRVAAPYMKACALLVVKADGTCLFMNEGVMYPFPFSDYPDSKQVWPIPDAEIDV
jgi:hypothetical protein